MIKAIAAITAASFAMTGCSNSSSPDAVPEPAAVSSVHATAQAPASGTPPTSASAAWQPGADQNRAAALPPLSEADKGEKGARAVLLTWARALENRQFDVAWQQFGHPPSSREAFAKWWQRYRTITVAVPDGKMDAGAGSLYYSVPATLTGMTTDGRPYKLQGDVILRRVNDVDGATAAQLRWHIDTADLK